MISQGRRRPPAGRWGVVASLLLACGGGADVTVGSKDFTESVILGELVSQQLERYGLRVDRRLHLGGTFISHEALRGGQIDVYVEYTGTAHAAILGRPTVRDAERVRREVDSVYADRWGLTWLGPLGFDNSFAMLVRGEVARRLGISSISEAVPAAREWRPGFGYEFMERADGYAGLVAAYGLAFGAAPTVMDLGLTYRALAEGTVDIIAGNATDGQIEALDLVHLQDDLRYFPPYEAAPVVRRDALARVPQLRDALGALEGSLTDAAMRRLNYLVDVEQRDVKDVVAAFLDTRRP